MNATSAYARLNKLSCTHVQVSIMHICFLGLLVFDITNCKHKQVYSKIAHFKVSSKSI